jgi:outer membrane beta-barrel protein
MMTSQLRRYLFLASIIATVGAWSGVACAADDPQATPPDQNQVVVPEVTRRDIEPPRYPSSDFDIGFYGGTYSTQNFGASAVGGLRLGYNITEDYFVQGVLASTTVSDKNYRQILPGGIFPNENERLTYYNLSAGYNFLPGEIFIGTTYATPFHVYVIAGVGNTSLDDQKHATFNFGSGMRLFLSDRYSVQIDARDHVFSMDLLGARERLQNLEFTIGFTASFF